MYGPPRTIYIAEGGQLAMGVALSFGYQGRGLWFLSPKVYDLSGGSCALGERSLLFQRKQNTALKCISYTQTVLNAPERILMMACLLLPAY